MMRMAWYVSARVPTMLYTNIECKYSLWFDNTEWYVLASVDVPLKRLYVVGYGR